MWLKKLQNYRIIDGIFRDYEFLEIVNFNANKGGRIWFESEEELKSMKDKKESIV